MACQMIHMMCNPMFKQSRRFRVLCYVPEVWSLGLRGLGFCAVALGV